MARGGDQTDTETLFRRAGIFANTAPQGYPSRSSGCQVALARSEQSPACRPIQWSLLAQKRCRDGRHLQSCPHSASWKTDPTLKAAASLCPHRRERPTA